jgi:hypothetical protein
MIARRLSCKAFRVNPHSNIRLTHYFLLHIQFSRFCTDVGQNTPVGTLSNVWFKWGWGADFGLTERIYLRHEIFYGIGTNSKPQKDHRDNINQITKVIDKVINHGLDIRLAVGYRF